MSAEKKPTTADSENYAKTSQKTGALGGKSENQPLLTEKAKELIQHATSQHFVAIRDETRGTIALMPIGWVGEPALVIAEIKLEDLKSLLEQL